VIDSTTFRADSTLVPVWVQFAEYGISQPLPLADILEQARTHAAPSKVFST
jgi:hypothetical protein